MQHNLCYEYPDLAQVKVMAEGIWSRKYYTNHGPLVESLESNIQSSFGVRNAVSMANSDIALLIVLLSLGQGRHAVVPNHISLSLKNALFRMKIPFSTYSHDLLHSNKLCFNEIKLYNNSIVIAFHFLGNSADIASLFDYCSASRSDLVLISDNHWHSYQDLDHKLFRLVELICFEQGQIVNGGVGACLLTDDDSLASSLRNIRSSYGAGNTVDIPFTGNGRMSEFQAGLALLSLSNIETQLNHLKDKKKKISNSFESIDSYPYHFRHVTTGDAYFALQALDQGAEEKALVFLSRFGSVFRGDSFVCCDSSGSVLEGLFFLNLNEKYILA